MKDIAESEKKRFWSKVKIGTISECWNYLGRRHEKGYGRFDYRGKQVSAHRFSWYLANDGDIRDLMVMHKCDNPSCVNPYHLTVGTNQDNMDDMKSKGRQPKNDGARNPRAKLSTADVEAIRKDGRSLAKIAKDYGVTFGCIGHIKRGFTWRQTA